jgi:hypothetical protein
VSRRRSAYFAALAIIVALTARSAGAEPTDELTSLQQEAARVRQSLNDLDARIRALEGVNPDARDSSDAVRTKAVPVESTFLSLQRSWSEIQPGIRQERVDALLGKPERVLHMNGDLVWYYVYPGFGRGSVFFNEEGKVSSAQAPRLGWSW